MQLFSFWQLRLYLQSINLPKSLDTNPPLKTLTHYLSSALIFSPSHTNVVISYREFLALTFT